MRHSLLLFFVLTLAICSFSQLTDGQFSSRLKQAQTLYQLGRAVDALPLFQELTQLRPDNIAAQEGYAMTLFMSSATQTDAEERKRMRCEARAAFMKARELGDTSNLVKLADDLPEDGSFESLSERSDVDAALQAGESAYAKGDYEVAISDYQKALALDPKTYLAALYIGDVLFKQAKYEDAGQWFQNAIMIDPNQETAYRYWGDALGSQGKWEEARGQVYRCHHRRAI